MMLAIQFICATDENGIHGSRSGLTWDDAKAREAENK
ncbi:hypothetical protein ANAEL_04937 [Anaerolineales bacterium]|nr:hypothetical protein ANAEL_04937 [Anaerolineales bacterium]